MTGLQWHSLRIRSEIKDLMLDGLHHDRSELMAIISANGGGYKQLPNSIRDLKDDGFYIEWDPAVGKYRWATHQVDTQRATAVSMDARAIPELVRRIRAQRGERLRAIHHRSETGQRDADAIALAEASLANMAVLAGRSPSALIAATHLTAWQESQIVAEVP